MPASSPGSTHPVAALGAVAVLAGVVAFWSLFCADPASGQPPAAVEARASVEFVVSASNGTPVHDLRPDECDVTVDGVARRVIGLRLVMRGPGAMADARALLDGRPAGSVAAEPARSILVLVDQASIVRGDEKPATAAARETIDRLGLDDRLALVRLPLDAGQPLAFETNRPALVAALPLVAGRLAQQELTPVSPFGGDTGGPPTSLNPERAGSTDLSAAAERERASAAALPIPDAPGTRTDTADAARDLAALMTALRKVEGRKDIVLISGGLVGADRANLDDLARSAAAAHVTVHAVLLRSAGQRGPAAPNRPALEALAASTGGGVTALGRNTGETVARALKGLTSRYVLTFEGTTPDRPVSVKVAVSRSGLTVRAPAWLAARPDPQDRVPTPDTDAESRAKLDAIPQTGVFERSTSPLPRVADPDQAALRERVLARVADYVEAYQREFASLVAEEEFEQTDHSPGARARRQRLRSDLLLVRLDRIEGWTAFRDVFEVNGEPVRERDDRLKRLFLDPVLDPWVRLEAVQEESARYNLGPVRRTLNAPLYGLAFLERAAHRRFVFWVEGETDVEGRPAWELSYREVWLPTMARTSAGDNQPARGRFVIDQATGAVLGIRILYERSGAGTMDYHVTFRRDEKLGLWLPASMEETYSANGRPVTRGVARYRNPRRFQVTTDTQVVVPK